MSGCLKLGGHFRIHRNHDFLFVIHYGVPMLDILIDPIFEAIPENGRTDIDQPLFWDFGQIYVIRKVAVNHVHVTHVLEDLLDRQVLVLRHIEGFHLVVLHVIFSPANDVLQKVNRDVL